MNLTVDIKNDKSHGIGDEKLIDGKITIEKVKDSNKNKDKDKDKEMVKINKDAEMEKDRCREEKEKNEISDNLDNLYHKKLVKILPNNCGTIFSIEASTCGASF